MGISVTAPVVRYGGAQSGGGGVVPPTVMQGPNGQPPQSMLSALVLPLPWLTPMPGAQQFNQESDAASAAVQTVVLPAPLSIDVPQGYRCRIASVSTYIDNMLTTTNVTWSVLVNNAPAAVAGFQNLKMFPRAAPFVGNTFDAFLLIQGPATITVQFSNNDGGTYIIGAALSGWVWNVALEAQWKNNGGQWAG